MSSQYFGFEDEEIPEVIDTITRTSCSSITKTPIVARVGSKSNDMPIQEIHRLLAADAVEESTLDSSVTVTESSFYGDDDTSIVSIPSIQKRRKTRKILVDSNSENSSTTSTPVRNYKKRVPRSATKNKENQPPKGPKRVKTAKENTPEENYDELADQLNKRFQEIENYKLIIE